MSVQASPTALPLQAAMSSAEGVPRVPPSLDADVAVLVSALEMELLSVPHPHTAAAARKPNTDRIIMFLL